MKAAKYRYLFVVLIILLIFDLIFGYRDRSFYAYFLDVGQGEATLLRTPEGRYVLIDTGPGRAAYEELSRYFPFGENTIDLLIISHFDNDHIGALPLILQSYRVNGVIYNEADPDFKDDWENYLQPYNRVQGDIKVGCCVMISFFENPVVDSRESNETSLAFRVDYQSLSFFFGGDLPSPEEDLIASAIGDIDVLKVSHHGSRNSTSKYFVDTIKPEVAIISAGGNNTYGHPHKEVLDIFNMNKIAVERTDIDGTQVLISDGITMELVSSDGCEQYCSYLIFLKKLLLSDQSLNYL